MRRVFGLVGRLAGRSGARGRTARAAPAAVVGLGAAGLAAVALVGAATVEAASPEPIEVPIYHRTTGGKRNFLIYVGVGGGPLNPYLFDTGSPAMYSTYGKWWPGHTTLVDAVGKKKITYASGTVYHYDGVRTAVSLGTREGTVIVTAPKARIGRITNADDQTPAASFHAWAAKVRDGKPPFTSDDTYGNFGAGLHGDPHLGTVLSQVPIDRGLRRGFVVMSGGRTARQGTLVIGLTQEMIAQFRWRLPMTPTGRELPAPLGASHGAPGYRKAQVANTVVRLARDGARWHDVIPTVFDTGGGDGTWAYGAEPPADFVKGRQSYGRARVGTDFSLEYAGRPILAYASGSKPASNILGFIEAERKDLRINPGILMFYTYDVMFDLDDGFIGLRPVTEAAE